MTVRVGVGLALSVVVVVAAIAYASDDSDVPPDLTWLNNYIAVMVGGFALGVIWLGVGLAALLARRRDKASWDKRA